MATKITEDLHYLVNYLVEERGQGAEGLPDEGDEALFAAFRALVNTREAAPISQEFLDVQDRVLQTIIAGNGITNSDMLPASPNDERLVLWQGDITRLGVDAIVNAANSGMLGCFVPGHHCIDNAIHTFAGVQLRLECAKIMAEQGTSEPTGSTKITQAYNLPSAHVIHTVGPIVESGNPNILQRAQLVDCYKSCLEAAAQADCTGIAFCGISTGVFGYPVEEAAPVAVDTVRAWLDGHPDCSIRRVVFNTFEERDTMVYSHVLSRIS